MDFDGLNNAANLAQLISLELLLQDKSNNDLMNELQHQNKEYLEQILKNQQEIIKLLKGLTNDRTNSK
jgi:beta-lactamase class A